MPTPLEQYHIDYQLMKDYNDQYANLDSQIKKSTGTDIPIYEVARRNRGINNNRQLLPMTAGHQG